MARGRVSLSVRRLTGWGGAFLGLALVSTAGVRMAYSQDTEPAPEPAAHPVTDTWAGDKLDPKWNVTVMGDAQDQEHEVKVENGLLRVTAGGSDIWGQQDNGIFIWQPANGDFQITLEHRALTRTDASAKAGIMVRSSLDTAAANTFLQVMPKGGALQSRFEHAAPDSGPGSGCPGENCNPWGNPDEEDENRPVILQRLTRIGTSIKAERSYDDGKTWVGIRLNDFADRDVAEIELPDDVLVGIAMTSHNAGEVGEAVFGRITFTQIATRPTNNGLIAATVVDEDGVPVPETGIEVLKGDERVGTSILVDEALASNTASFFLPPGVYTVRAGETDIYAAGPPVSVELTTGKVENLKLKPGAAK